MFPSNIFKELTNLTFLCIKKGHLKNNFCPLIYNSILNGCNLYSTVTDGNQRIPLDEISSLNFHPLNCDEEKLAVIIDEIQQLKSLGKRLPQFIKLSDVVDLTEAATRSQRMKYLDYLFKKEIKKLNEADKKLKEKMERKNRIVKNRSDTDHIQYGLGKNTLLLKTWKRSLLNFYNKRFANSVLFGQKIVIDLSYDEYMSKKERKACASQVRLLHSFNKFNRNPYDLYFCNANPNSRCVQYLLEDIPNIDESLATISEKSYLDIFPKEDLVYLSPHASETLKTYDHAAVYIIGGFVDTVKKNHISFCKAKDEGIKSYALPLGEYIAWGFGSKSLSINQVFSIMQTLRDTGDWRKAFQHVPSRKFKRVEANSEESHLLSDKLFVMSN